MRWIVLALFGTILGRTIGTIFIIILNFAPSSDGPSYPASAWPVHGNANICWTVGGNGFTVWQGCEATAGATGTCNSTDPETCIFYVDVTSTGSCTPQPQPMTNTPSSAITCASWTLAEAAISTLSRAGKPDWILIKRGQTFVNGNPTSGLLNSSGPSPDHPRLIATYGTGTVRPIIEVDTTHSANAAIYCSGARACGDNTDIIGIDLYAYTRDPSNGSFTTAEAAAVSGGIKNINDNPVSSFLVEDCVIRFFGGDGISWSPLSGTFSPMTITVRRNIIHDNYFSNFGNTAQGIFIADVAHVFVQQNVLDTNGWNPTLSAFVGVTVSNTASSPIVITWSDPTTLAYLSNGTLVAFSKTGGNISNASVYCVDNLSGSTFNIKATLSNHVTCTGTDLLATGSEIASQNGQWVLYAKDTFNRNIYVSGTVGPDVSFLENISTNSSSTGVQMRTGGPATNNYFDSDTLGFSYGCTGDTGCSTPRTSGTAFHNVVMHSNDSSISQNTGEGIENENFSNFNANTNIVAHQNSAGNNPAVVLTSTATGASVINNIICDWGPSTATYISDSGGNTTTPNTLSTTCSSSVDAGSYYGSVGGSPATLAGFVSAAESRGLGVWDGIYTAAAVNAYVRAAFGQP